MKLCYVGPCDEVRLETDPPVNVTRGGTVDVVDDIGAGLLLQDVWEAASTKPVKES